MRTRIRRRLAAALTGVLLAAVGPAIAHAQPPSDEVPAPPAHLLDVGDDRYGIQNYKSRKYLQPAGGVVTNGAKIVQMPESLGSDGDFAETQNWYVFSAGSSYVSLENDNSGRNLGIDGASTTSGAAAIQANGSSDLNQDWELITKTSYPAGWYALKNRKSGLCRGISGASTANGAQAAQFACDDSANQLWKPDDR